MKTCYDLTEFRAKLRAEKELYTYDELVQSYGVNKFYLWSIVDSADYIPPPKVAAKLGILILRPTPACAHCGEVHTLGDICPVITPVEVVVYEMTAAELALVDRPVTVIYKRPRSARKAPPRPRASINIEDPESAARTIAAKMEPEQLAALAHLLVIRANGHSLE